MLPARALALVLAVTTSGCVSQLDMASVTDGGRPATTIPYNGVRGARTFADYESVSRSILTGADPAGAGPATKPGSKARSGKGSK